MAAHRLSVALSHLHVDGEHQDEQQQNMAAGEKAEKIGQQDALRMTPLSAAAAASSKVRQTKRMLGVCLCKKKNKKLIVSHK